MGIIYYMGEKASNNSINPYQQILEQKIKPDSLVVIKTGLSPFPYKSTEPSKGGTQKETK